MSKSRKFGNNKFDTKKEYLEYLSDLKREFHKVMSNYRPMFKYVRDNKRRPIGVLLAYKDGRDIRFGWSRANRSAGDSFERFEGILMAVERASTNSTLPIPHSLKSDSDRFLGRASRYYKDATL